MPTVILCIDFVNGSFFPAHSANRHWLLFNHVNGTYSMHKARTMNRHFFLSLSLHFPNRLFNVLRLVRQIVCIDSWPYCAQCIIAYQNYIDLTCIFVWTLLLLLLLFRNAETIRGGRVPTVKHSLFIVASRYFV